MAPTQTHRGRLVAICGIDGSGKATQTELLARRAEAEGFRVQEVSFPRYGQGFFADLIERYLRGEFAERAADVSPYLATLPYALDRWQAAPQLRDWLAAGRLVLCNRYVPANLAHQGSKLPSEAERRAFFEWVARLEYGILELPRPDLHILLEMPPEAAMRLVRERGSRTAGPPQGRDIHEADPGHLQATAAAYRQVAGETSGPWAVIACWHGGAVLPRDEIAGKVWAEVRKML